MLQRKVIYTGMTRAKEKVAFIGERDALALAASGRLDVQQRYTQLADKLRFECGKQITNK